MNLASYFEIPALDLDRAMTFYGAVFGCAFECIHVDGNEMAFFPYAENQPGASGALAKGDSYVPGKAGVRIYFDVADIQQTLQKALDAGGKVLYPETAVGAFGRVAEIEDSEGNCIGLHAAEK
ncbi:VOC family protein [Achromobacter seleniivolatilans]|uniref:VOC family protein n=1 Tax=Achromobacter seleniivolatilans TaxID=3047478 RepID=A0ABY9M869_9BURK|nr:VOC family protein [Achromobacter sp. R39]WMD22803.1 VOC family protein [Achromobacter sp. R39]